MTEALVAELKILPAREVPLDNDDVATFRRRYRARFEGQPSKSRVYRDISDRIALGGIEYYLPLFFDSTAMLLDYLPGNALVFSPVDLPALLQNAWQEIAERHELYRHDLERPILDPVEACHEPGMIAERLRRFGLVH
jgi:transcription-repair coupling factor (superfamily II helicase)